MLLVIEPIFADFQHAPVNAGHLRAVLQAFPRERIAFAAHPQHRAAVFECLGAEARARLIECDAAPVGGGGIRFGRFRAQADAMARLIGSLEPRVVLCLAATPETLFAARLMVALWRRLRVVVVLHGMLYNTIGWRSRDPRHRLFDDTSALRVADHPRIRYVVLEDIIRARGAELGRLDPERCDVWPHVLNDDELWDAPHLPDPRRLRLGFLGFATEDKGYPRFLALARRAAARKTGVEFRAIGGLAGHSAEDGGVVSSAGLGLDRQAFLAEVRALDFAFLALDDRRYTLTSSGSAVDCFAALTPVIALDGAAVRHYAASPPIGYIAGDAAELAALLDEPAALADPGRYAAFRENLRQRRAARLPHALAPLVGATLGA